MTERSDEQVQRMLRSLDGLSVGDSFGECFFPIQLSEQSWRLHHETRTLPRIMGRWTDDTAMACAIVEVVMRHGAIDQDALADAFGRWYAWDDGRGYGGTAHGILRAIGQGESWRTVSPAVRSGGGSMGNGAAMRIAPLGAYFADDVNELIEQATRSAAVTHAHPEGIAGAIAVALAGSFMVRRQTVDREAFFEFILQNTPDSLTRARIGQARQMPSDYSIDTVISVVGNGSKIIAPDTVPFCIWCVARGMTSFENAMWTTVSAGGDMDTNCAIVGGILSCSDQYQPPTSWLERREPLTRLHDVLARAEPGFPQAE